MKLSVIISSYQSEKLITACLDALSKQTYTNIEIIVVDANSTDQTLDIIENKFPEVILIKNNERIGVGAALNKGLNIASGDIIAIDFNTDEVADSTWAEEIISAHSKWGRGWIIGTTRLSQNNLVDEYGVKLWKHTGSYHIGKNRKYDPNRPSEICDFVGLSSFHRSLLKYVRQVDENYIFYGADADFNLRAKLVGFKTRTNPKAITTHVHSASKSANPIRYYELMTFGLFRLAMIHRKFSDFIYTMGYSLIYSTTVLLIRSIQAVKNNRLDLNREFYFAITGRFRGFVRFIKSINISYRRRKIIQNLIQGRT